MSITKGASALLACAVTLSACGDGGGSSEGEPARTDERDGDVPAGAVDLVDIPFAGEDEPLCEARP